MLMQLSMKKEEFSRAFVLAIAAKAGCSNSKPSVDCDSVDLTLSMDGIQGALLQSAGLDIQLKCTSQDLENDGVFKFPLPIKNYNDLRAKVMTPRILVVVQVPEEIEDWLLQDSDKLCLFKCAYWYSLAGLPDTNNTSSVTVHIPTTQVFTAKFLEDAIHKIANGEDI